MANPNRLRFGASTASGRKRFFCLLQYLGRGGDQRAGEEVRPRAAVGDGEVVQRVGAGPAVDADQALEVGEVVRIVVDADVEQVVARAERGVEVRGELR